MEENNTIYISEEIGKCESVEELKEKIFPMLKTQQEQWKRKINDIYEKSGMSKTDFARKCKTSRVSLDKWCKGVIPKNRETFIRIGLCGGLSVDEINELLQRYGRYPALYSKNPEDCVCIYVAREDNAGDRVEKYEYILSLIKEDITKSANERDNTTKTVYFDKKLSEVASDSELEEFVKENTAVFAGAYNRLYEYVKMYLDLNFENTNTGSVYEMALGQEWSSSLRQCVSAIRQGKWIPNRNKIISLGIHLNMTREEIDDMLDAAHMEPLCAKNIFESVIIYALEDADINGMFDTDPDDDNYDPDMLCHQCRDILEQFDLPDISDFISELPERD